MSTSTPGTRRPRLSAHTETGTDPAATRPATATERPVRQDAPTKETTTGLPAAVVPARGYETLTVRDRLADFFHRRRRALIRVPLLIVGAVVLVVLVAWGVDSVMHAGDTLSGVRLGGIDVGGDTEAAVAETLGAAAADREATPQPVTVDGQAGELIPAESGFSIDEKAAVAAAMAWGRTANPLARFTGWARGRIGGVDLDWPTAVDKTALQAKLDAIGFPSKAAPVEPVVEFEGVEPKLSKGVDGRGIDTAPARSALADAFESVPRKTLTLPLAAIPPLWSDKQANAAAADAKASLLAAPVSVKLGADTSELKPEEIGPLLVSDPSGKAFAFHVSQDEAVALLRPRFASRTPPVDARFNIVGNDVQIVPGAMGRGCCGPDTAAKLDAALANPDAAARVADLPEGDVPPKLSSDDLKGFGVTTKLGEFTTNHAAGQPRVQNIHKISDVLRGTIVRKGETFSVNKTVGKRTEDKGWVKAPVINEGKFDESVGGGISQFATTMYNALYFSGVKIEEHSPHTIYISRYPKGREATLSYPNPDLVFTNDTPNAVVIWTSHNDTSITVQIWGTSDGRQVTASEPEVRMEGACEIVKVTRTVRYPDGRVATEPFTQRYKPEGKSC